MRYLGLAVLSAIVFLSAGCASKVEEKPLSELDQLLEKIERSADPEKVGVNIKTMRISATTVITGQNIKMNMVMTYKFPDQIREEVNMAGMMNVVTIFDGKSGVEITKGLGSRKLSEAEVNGKKFDLLIMSPQKSLKDAFAEITLAPEKVIIDGKSCYHLTGKPAPELKIAPVEMYFDAETYLMTRQEAVLPSAMGDIPMTIDAFDYHDIDGLFLSMRSIARSLGMTLSVTIDKVELNPSLKDDEFKVPEEDD